MGGAPPVGGSLRAERSAGVVFNSVVDLLLLLLVCLADSLYPDD